MKTKKGLHNTRVIEGIITLKITAEVPNGELELSNEEAMLLLQKELNYLSESNDGSELLANSTIILVE